MDTIIDSKYHDESKMHRAHTDPFYEDLCSDTKKNLFLNLWPTNMYMELLGWDLWGINGIWGN